MRLELFYDVVSPWSYLCFEALCRVRTAWQLDLELRPAFLGGVMQATGNAPPTSVPARAVYLMQDLARSSRYFDVPLTFPAAFPANTIMPMRLLCLVRRDAPALMEPLTRALWQRYWGEGLDIGDIDDVRSVCSDFGVAQGLCDRLQDDDTKQLLRDSTIEAVNRGAFGFPAIFTQDEEGADRLYFGSDRLAQLAFDYGLPWHGPPRA